MSATTHWVSDEVWARLDPRAGRMTRRGRLALAAILLLAALGVVAMIAVRHSGLFTPHVGAWASEVTIDEHDHSAVERLHVGNNDWFAERVEGVSTRTPGVAIADWSTATIPAGGDGTVTVRMDFDCTAAAQGPVTVTLWLYRPWGNARATVWGPDMPGSDSDPQAVDVFMNGPGWAACGKGLD